MEEMVPLDRWGHLVLWDQWVLQENEDLKVTMEWMELQADQDVRVTRDHLEHQVCLCLSRTAVVDFLFYHDCLNFIRFTAKYYYS